VLVALDAAPVRLVRCLSLALVSRAHRTLNTGRRVFTIRASGEDRHLRAFLTRASDTPESIQWSASGDPAHFTLSLRTDPVSTECFWCSLDSAQWFGCSR